CRSVSLVRRPVPAARGVPVRRGPDPRAENAPGGLAHRLDDLLGELRELLQPGDALLLQTVDEALVLSRAPLPFVQAPWFEQLGIVELRDGAGDQIAEVLVIGPRDRLLGDALHA